MQIEQQLDKKARNPKTPYRPNPRNISKNPLQSLKCRNTETLRSQRRYTNILLVEVRDDKRSRGSSGDFRTPYDSNVYERGVVVRGYRGDRNDVEDADRSEIDFD